MICNLGGVWTLSRLKQKKTENYQTKFNKIRKLSREQTLVTSTHPPTEIRTDHGNETSISQSATIDLRSFRLEYLELQKSNWCELNFVGFLTQRTIALNVSQKWCHMREICFFKDDNWILPANRFCEETSPNYVPKHLNRHPSFYFSNLAPVSQSLKISCKTISYF